MWFKQVCYTGKVFISMVALCANSLVLCEISKINTSRINTSRINIQGPGINRLTSK